MQGSWEAEEEPQSWASLPCLTHPEDVIDEESAKQDAASAHVVQVQKLYPIKGEGQAKQVVGNPVLKKGGSETSSLCPILPHHPKLHLYITNKYYPWAFLRAEHLVQSKLINLPSKERQSGI